MMTMKAIIRIIQNKQRRKGKGGEHGCSKKNRRIGTDDDDDDDDDNGDSHELYAEDDYDNEGGTVTVDCGAVVVFVRVGVGTTCICIGRW